MVVYCIEPIVANTAGPLSSKWDTWALVSRCTQLSGRIGLLLGAPVPFVLRLMPDIINSVGVRKIQLVRDAYVHEMLDGEGINTTSHLKRSG